MNKYECYEIEKKETIEVIKGSFLSIKKEKYTLKNKEEFIREELIKNGGSSNAVIILALTKANEVIITVQPRVHKKGVVSYELPAGYIDEDESPEDAAKRELLEETGYSSNKVINLGSYYQDQGISKVINSCFLFRNCEKVADQNLDKDEYISVEKIGLEKVYQMLDENIINDAGSIITLLKGLKYV